MGGPVITVITPSYNKAPFLETCIRSVVEQDYPHVEYIVIDGGSTDGSVEIIKKYEKYIVYWVSEPDGGQSDAINKGLARATGDLVAWLNADDFYLPGALSAVAAAYRRYPGASFYFGDGVRVDEAGRPRRGFFPEGRPVFHRPALIYGLNYIMQQAAFINRRYLVQVGGLDPSLHYGMDTDLWIRLSALAPPVPIPAKLAAIREYSQTKSRQGGFRRIEELRQVAERHSGLAMTPGVLCYFLDTLHQYAREHPEVYPSSFLGEVERFWAAAARLLWQFGARPDGFPEGLEGSARSSGPPLRHRWWSFRRRVWWWLKRKTGASVGRGTSGARGGTRCASGST